MRVRTTTSLKEARRKLVLPVTGVYRGKWRSKKARSLTAVSRSGTWIRTRPSPYTRRISTYTDRNQGSKPSESESIPRPRIAQGMSIESWNSFKAPRKLYKTGTSLSEAERSLQSTHRRDKEFPEQSLCADPEFTAKPAAAQPGPIRKLGVAPVAVTQGTSELSRTNPAKVRGKAATCKFTTKCREEYCREEVESAEATNIIVKYILVNDSVDTVACREISGWKLLDESPLTGIVAL